jgi:AcrR family transcriptional regulator
MAYLSFDERRRRIIDAAIEVIASEGLAATTTRRIAERAEAPLGSLHYCFRDKDELVQLIAERGAQMLIDAFAPVDAERGLEATIRDSIDSLWRWYEDNIGLQLALTELGMNRIRRGGDPKEIYAMWGPFGHDLMADHLARAAKVDRRKLKVPIEEVVRFILHRFDGLTIEYAASRDRVACKRQVDLLADAIVAVALPPSKTAPRKTPPRKAAAPRTARAAAAAPAPTR